MWSMKTSSSAASATAFAPYFRQGCSDCDLGFCRKGLPEGKEFQLAVRVWPVYNPALRCFLKLRFLLRS